MKRKWVIRGIIAAPFVAAALAFPIFARARENARRSSCANNLKQIGLGLAQYSQDFDDKVPPVALHSAAEVQRILKANSKLRSSDQEHAQKVPPFGWCDGLQIYLRSVCVLQCPSETSEPRSDNDSTQRGYTDYWLNARVAGHKFGGAKGQNVIMSGDGSGNAQSDARYNVSTLPINMNSESAYAGAQPTWPQRHVGGANYLFLDGHVKWVMPAAVSNAPGGAYTFAP